MKNKMLCGRLNREKKTLNAMVRIYCAHCHQAGCGLCAECGDFLEYASRRLDKCPFGDKKPTCRNCTVHCHDASRREVAKTVMKFSGPRLLKKHPCLAVMHIVDKWRDKSHLAVEKSG